MMKDLYAVLGVARNATDAEIKQAFRRLASQHHPDKGGDKERFQEIQEAYAVLSDPQRRAEHDLPPQARMNMGPGGFDFNNIFDMFGVRFGDAMPRQNSARIQLWITLADVATGGPRTISVSSPAGQHNLEITIPAGIEDGASVRYPRVAPGGLDLVVTFRVRPESGWQREDQHVIRDILVDVWDLILGQDIEIATLTGRSIMVKIPAMTQPGTMLRVRGHGLPRRNQAQPGDLLVRVTAALPRDISQELLEHIRNERGR